VGFGPVEGDSLWAEGFEVVDDRLKEGEFGWVLQEWGGGWALNDIRDGLAVRVDGITVLKRESPLALG
jgi:hypothetical protein